MIQSTFSKFPKSKLVLMSKALIDADFEFEEPYDEAEKNFVKLENIMKYFGEVVSSEDFQFLAKFMKINFPVLSEIYQTKDKSLYDKLIIPIPKEYKVDYYVWGSCTYTEYLEDKVTCYDKNWVKDSLYQDERDGNWNMFEGRNINTEYDNHEMSDWTIEDVQPIDSKMNESIFTKMILENKTPVLDTLDKKTLLKLKSIIENKLRSL